MQKRRLDARGRRAAAAARRTLRARDEVAQPELCRLRLAGAALAADQYGLRLALAQRGAISALGEHVHVRRQLVPRASVRRARAREDGLVEVGDILERIDRHENGANERVDLIARVARAQIVEDGELVQMRQLHKIRRALERKRVRLADQLSLLRGRRERAATLERLECNRHARRVAVAAGYPRGSADEPLVRHEHELAARKLARHVCLGGCGGSKLPLVVKDTGSKGTGTRFHQGIR